MKISFVEVGWDDYCHWQSNDKRLIKKINALLDDIARHPFEGISKPEPLKHDFAGLWSRRINDEHRLVYEVQDDTISVIQCRGHY